MRNRKDLEEDQKFDQETKKIKDSQKRRRQAKTLARDSSMVQVVACTYGKRDPKTGERKLNSRSGEIRAIDIGICSKPIGSPVPSTIIGRSGISFCDYKV